MMTPRSQAPRFGLVDVTRSKSTVVPTCNGSAAACQTVAQKQIANSVRSFLIPPPAKCCREGLVSCRVAVNPNFGLPSIAAIIKNVEAIVCIDYCMTELGGVAVLSARPAVGLAPATPRNLRLS